MHVLGPLGQKPPGDVELSKALVRTELQPQGDDADRVDIAIDIPGLMVWIEAKIDLYRPEVRLVSTQYATRLSSGGGNRLLQLSQRHSSSLSLSMIALPPSFNDRHTPFIE
jgi:hypothetical protein